MSHRTHVVAALLLAVVVGGCGRLRDETLAPAEHPLGETSPIEACPSVFASTLPMLTSDAELVAAIRHVAGLPVEPPVPVPGTHCETMDPSTPGVYWRPFYTRGADADAIGEPARVKRIGGTLLALYGRRLHAIAIDRPGLPRLLGSVTSGDDASALVVHDDRVYVLSPTGDEHRGSVSVQSFRLRATGLEPLATIGIDAIRGQLGARIIGGQLVVLVSSGAASACWDGRAAPSIPTLRNGSNAGPLFAATDVAAPVGTPDPLSGPADGWTNFLTVLRCDLPPDGSFACAPRTVLGRGASSLDRMAVVEGGDHDIAIHPNTLAVAVHSRPRGTAVASHTTCETHTAIRSGALSSLRFADFDARGEQTVVAGWPVGSPRSASFAGDDALTLDSDGRLVAFSITSGRARGVSIAPGYLQLLVVDARHVLATRYDAGESMTSTAIDLSTDAPTTAPVAGMRGTPQLTRNGVIASLAPRDSEHMGGIELVRDALVGTIPNPAPAMICYEDCPWLGPLPIFAGPRAFTLIGSELREIDTSTLTPVGTALSLE